MPKLNAAITWSIVYAVIGGLIFILGLNLLGSIPERFRDFYKVGLPVLLLLAYLVSHKVFPSHQTAFLGFFLAALAWTIENYLTGKIRGLFLWNTQELTGFTSTMVVSTLLVAIPIIIGWLLSGHTLADLYLQGSSNLWGIGLGLAGLILFGGLGILQALGQGLALNVIAAALPMAFVFSLANAFREELVYRAVFLKGFQETIGLVAAVIVTTLIFTLAHLNPGYTTASLIVFVVILVMIGVVGSLIMVKTGSLIGAVLFHVGADVLLIMGMLSSQQLVLRT